MSSGFIQNHPVGLIDGQGNVIPNSYEEESFRGDYVGGLNLIYAGYARPGADEGSLVWQIFKMAYDANNNVLSIRWPQDSFGRASNDYQFSWTDHASYTYV